MDFSEKRQSKRIKRSFTARIKTLQNEDAKEKAVKWDIVTMKDLSASGISFNYTSKIPAKTALELNISLPFVKDGICCAGEVCRIDEKRPVNPMVAITKPPIPVYIIAAYFTQMQDSQKEALESYINNF
ncbi:MAG: PilZ domain-containing protein [Candidatus Omnitrophota bacterium]